MELSVVIPVYNGEDFIRQTIESVLINSLDFQVECIVIDDGSTDQTPNILESYGNRIITIRQENAGEGAAVNKGLDVAKGSYAVVISADDPVLSSKLFEGVTTFFESHLNAVAWYPDWNIIDDHEQVLSTVLLPKYDFNDLFSRNKVLPGPGTWFRTQTALAINGRRIKWKYVGDYDFWLRLSMQGSLVHREGVLAQWRRHPRSTSISKRGFDMSQERIFVIEEFIEEFKSALHPRSISLARANANYLAAKLGFFSKDVNSRKLIMRALNQDLRVLLSAKPHELFFMFTFPASKILLDYLKKFHKKSA